MGMHPDLCGVPAIKIPRRKISSWNGSVSKACRALGDIDIFAGLFTPTAGALRGGFQKRREANLASTLASSFCVQRETAAARSVGWNCNVLIVAVHTALPLPSESPTWPGPLRRTTERRLEAPVGPPAPSRSSWRRRWQSQSWAGTCRRGRPLILGLVAEDSIRNEAHQDLTNPCPAASPSLVLLPYSCRRCEAAISDRCDRGGQLLHRIGNYCHPRPLTQVTRP